MEWDWGKTCINPAEVSGVDGPPAVQQMPEDDRGPPDISSSSFSSMVDFDFDGQETLPYDNHFAAPSSGTAEMNIMSSDKDNTLFGVADSAAYPSAQNPHSSSHQYQDRHSQNSTKRGRTSEDFQMDSENNQRETMAENPFCSQNPSTNPESSISLDPHLSMSCSSRTGGLFDEKLCFLDDCPDVYNEAIETVSDILKGDKFTRYHIDAKVDLLVRRLYQFYQEHAEKTTQTDQPSMEIVRTVVKEVLEHVITPEEQCSDLVSKVDSLYGKHGWVPKDNGDSGLGSSRGPGLPSSAQPASNCQLPSPQERAPKKRRVDTNDLPKPVKSKAKQRPKKRCTYCSKEYLTTSYSTHEKDQHIPTLYFCPVGEEGKACREGPKREAYLLGHIKSCHLKVKVLGSEAKKKITEVIPDYRFQVPEKYTSSYYESCPCCRSGPKFKGWKESIEHLVHHYFTEHDSSDQTINLAVNPTEGQRALDDALSAFSAKWRDLPRLGIDYLKRLDEPRPAGSTLSVSENNGRNNGSEDDDSHHGGSSGHISRGSPSTEHGSGHGGHGGGCGGDNGEGPRDGGGRDSSSNGGGTTRKDLPRGGGGNYKNRMKAILAPGAFKRRSPSFFFGERRVALYESIRELGRGGFSVVDEVKRLDTGQIWARKSIPRLLGMHSKVESEINTLKGLDHSHIIKLIDFYFELSRVYLIIAPVAEGDLAIFLRDLSQKKEGLQIYPSELERRTIRKWITCLASAVGYLHGKGIVHGDIKPRNILISSSEIFLTDFGFSSAHGLTPKYCSPEAVKPPSAGQICGKAGDIFSLGCVYAEMLTVYSGQSLREFERFRTLDGGNTAYHSSIVRCHCWLDTLTVPSDFSPGYLYDFLDVVKSMLSFNPTSRPKIEGLIAHFQNFWPSTSSRTYSIASQNNLDCWCYQSIQVQRLSDTLPPKTELFGKNAHREGKMLQESVSLRSCDNGSNVWPDEIVTQRCVGLLFEVQKSTVQTWDMTTGKWISLPASRHMPKVILRNSNPSQEKNVIFSSFLLVTSSKHDELLSLYEELANRRLEQAPISLAPRIIAATDTPKDGSFWGFHELEDYFRITPPPSSAEETMHLWISVFGLLESQKWSRRLGSMKKIPAAISLFKDLEIVLVHEVQGKSPYEWNFGLSNSPAEYDFHSRVISDQPTISETRRCRNSSLAAESVNVCISVSMMVLEWIFQHPKTSLSNDKRTSRVRRNVEEKIIETLLEKGARCGPHSVTGAVVRNLIKPLLLQVPPRSPTANPTDTLHQCSAMAMDVLQHSWRTHITFNITPPLPIKNPKFYVFSISKEFNGEDGSGDEKSEKSVILYKYPLDRYFRESVDYKSLVVPEHDSVRMASRKLHRRMLELLVKRF
ncbi:hypothetical protein HYFRA_00008354 [Hymenoscyphus fraxineus]|uniref:Protein kinase domain-containing protein n=1 Tax=Hymenoscyphus fraxineus TaxID=746836 RepID=A0A9N9PFA5_9HELO|nr:hypothetical protein HYFRA_00008354 [Hymenoscyphus fraxineus]